MKYVEEIFLVSCFVSMVTSALPNAFILLPGMMMNMMMNMTKNMTMNKIMNMAMNRRMNMMTMTHNAFIVGSFGKMEEEPVPSFDVSPSSSSSSSSLSLS